MTTLVLQGATTELILTSPGVVLTLGVPIQASAGGSSPWSEDDFTPTQGQNSFPLGSAPSDVVSLGFFVNGVRSDEGFHYTLAGSLITWLDVFIMDPNDRVQARYQ